MTRRPIGALLPAAPSQTGWSGHETSAVQYELYLYCAIKSLLCGNTKLVSRGVGNKSASG